MVGERVGDLATPFAGSKNAPPGLGSPLTGARAGLDASDGIGAGAENVTQQRIFVLSKTFRSSRTLSRDSK